MGAEGRRRRNVLIFSISLSEMKEEESNFCTLQQQQQ